MKQSFTVNQRVKRGVVRGTVLEILKTHGFVTQYIVRMDNGAKVLGTVHQFQPVYKG